MRFKHTNLNKKLGKKRIINYKILSELIQFNDEFDVKSDEIFIKIEKEKI